jgi:rhodanese-related sulfurtransferase
MTIVEKSMKTSSAVVLAVALTAVTTVVQGQAPQPVQSSASPAASNTKVLERAEIDALLAQPSTVLVLDVRRPDEIAAIGGFPAYLSIQAGDLQKHLFAIPRDRVIVTVSNHAARARRAAQLLETNGFNVAGAAGAQDYEAEGGTLVKVAPPTRGEKP